VNEQNLKLTHVKKESQVFLYSDDEASSEDEAEPDMGSEDSVSIPLTRESVLASKDSSERGVSIPHSLPNNYVQPYVENAFDYDDGVEPKVSIPLIQKRVPPSKDSPERGVSMPHSLPNNYVRPYVEDGSDHDVDVGPKISNVS
jgi:hypothetical protein